MDRVVGTVEQWRVATIGAIAGACTGGGAGIATCCDIRIGTESARIGFPIARTLGNCLSMSNISRVVALVGPARTKDLIFTARQKSGRSEEHTSELQSPDHLVCRLLLEKKKHLNQPRVKNQEVRKCHQ